MTTAAAAAVGVLVGGGGVLAFRISERVQGAPRRPAPDDGAGLPAGVSDVLLALRSSAVVLDATDAVVKASAAAYATGVVSGRELGHARLRQMVRECRRDGVVREAEEELEGGLGRPRTVVLARVSPLGAHHVLLLLEDRTEARRVEAVRRDFVANVSHELKTPVGALSLLAEAVEDAADDPVAVRRFTHRMHRESRRLTQLVQEIIDLSRLQAAEGMVEPTLLEVDALIAEAVDRTGSVAQERGSEVVVAGQRGAQVVGDRELLVTAVRNLVHNALAYSPEGSRVVVEVRRTADADGGGRAVDVAVCDRGVGISPADLERIFERFYRVDAARSRVTGGTGLGLSIVKHVAGNHGGDVRVWSVEGEGSTFTLRLPDATGEPSTADGAPPEAEPGRSSASRPGAAAEPTRPPERRTGRHPHLTARRAPRGAGSRPADDVEGTPTHDDTSTEARP
ncbi:two-component sensor histidine kinase [Kineococcus sp. R8]|nr:ATP-binding protein [Kineococcus siccus]NAZ81419.1 two-component sensor histidine kinase [Kineococcus siccus]